ncbi:MAG: aminodeoxychorismate/anthranilate synthase component II [Myxococcota bacterium]
MPATKPVPPGRSLSIALLDHTDSFVHNIAHAIRRRGWDCDVIPREAQRLTELLDPTKYGGWILGPGPCTPAHAEVGRALVEKLVMAQADRRPLLGICLGLQTLAVALGGRVVRAREAVHGRNVTVRHDATGVLRGLPSPLEVTRYNSLVVAPSALPASLYATAFDPHGDIMALRHVTLPLEGVQFHPESWLDDGAGRVFDNWLEAVAAQAAGDTLPADLRRGRPYP